MADIRESKPERGRGAKGLLRERPLLSPIHNISPGETRGRFCGGTSLPHKKKNICASWPRPKPPDQDKTDIIRGGDFHIGVDDDLDNWA